MFHAVLKKNEEVLRNLLATLLEMNEADIVSCHIENPIELGKEIEGHWTNRSLLYWARAYDILKSGEGYDMLLPTYHIGILDFTLFEDHPKFMAKYQIMDLEDCYLYSDKYKGA